MIKCFFSFLMLFSYSFMKAQETKVITFNIRYANESDGYNKWSLRKSSVIDFLKYEAPDFLGLQEALLGQIKDLEKELDEYAWIGVGRDDGKIRGEFSPLFYDKSKWKLLEGSTFWLSETPEKPSKGWDAALPRICTWGKFQSIEDDRIIYVFNTHYDHMGQQARIQSSHMILSKIDSISGFNQTILIGDFNEESESEVISPILNSSLSDALNVAEITYGQRGTFNGFKISEIPTRRIDYIFHSSDLEPIKHTVDSRVINGRYLSDHFPVIVTFGQ